MTFGRLRLTLMERGLMPGKLSLTFDKVILIIVSPQELSKGVTLGLSKGKNSFYSSTFKLYAMGGNSKFLAGILLGAAAGAAIAIFLNTEKGKEILEDIKDAAGKAGDNIKDAAKRFGDEVASVVEKGKEYAESFGDKADDYAAQNNS